MADLIDPQTGETFLDFIAGIARDSYDGTAGVGVYCNDCKEWILDGCDFNDRLTVDQVMAAVESHPTLKFADGYTGKHAPDTNPRVNDD